MNMQECSRLILGLRAAGWSDKQITDFILYVEGGSAMPVIDVPVPENLPHQEKESS